MGITCCHDMFTGAQIFCGDCREVLPELPELVDATVCDPPYGLTASKKGTGGGFMGQLWDSSVPDVEYWKIIKDAMKPGAHLLAFGGTRTFHRLTCAIEDAGFEIRDCLMWVHAQGFPKNLDVGKQLDKQEKNKWVKIVKEIDNLIDADILKVWKEHSDCVLSAGLKFRSTSGKDGSPTRNANTARGPVLTSALNDRDQKSTRIELNTVKHVESKFGKKRIEIGMSTPRNDSVPGCVVLQADLKNSNAHAVIAELRLNEVRPTCAEKSIAPISAVVSEQQSPAKFAGSQLQNAPAKPVLTGTVHVGVRDWQSESIMGKLKAVEALKTWLGRNRSSKQADTAALCVALTDDLKRIILSQSKTFQNFDTICQTACASAIAVTITESTAASLISFMVDILRREAIDKAAGAERQRIPKGKPVKRIIPGADQNKKGWKKDDGREYQPADEVPATDAAKQWEGWGTALKPAWEPIILARKPLSEKTVAANVLKHGTGALNIDGCRVEGAPPKVTGQGWEGSTGYGRGDDAPVREFKQPKGRWPANFLHDGSEEALAGLPETAGGDKRGKGQGKRSGGFVDVGSERGDSEPCGQLYDDKGSAARYFYCAKTSKRERGEGNTHPCVKPIALMRYLCRLVTPPGGVVLDPFMGSGSTLIAAYREGFPSIGVELEADYCDIVWKRLAEEDPDVTKRKGGEKR